MRHNMKTIIFKEQPASSIALTRYEVNTAVKAVGLPTTGMKSSKFANKEFLIRQSF
jgi:hypothetical protein